MNILIVHNYYKIPGGEDIVVENERRLLKEHGHKVILYKKSNADLDSYSKAQRIRLPLDIIYSKKVYKEVSVIIDREKIDVMHVHNTVCMISPSVYYAAIKKNIPVVQTIHNFRLICPGAALIRDGKICDECITCGTLLHSVKYGCYRNSKVNTLAVALMEMIHKQIGTYGKINYICLTEFNKEQLLRVNKNTKEYIRPSQIYIKPNFVVRERTIKPYLRRKEQIVYVGRLDSTKGLRILFESWKRISRYELVVCGTGPEEGWCQKYIHDNRIRNITMKGFIPNDAVMEIIADSKALILPTQWYEGFPMVLVESFACGTPVLGSQIGNVGSIIQEGINGFHFNQNSTDSIVEAVGKLHDICESTKRTSKELYSPEANYRILMNVYEKCIDKSH